MYTVREWYLEDDAPHEVEVAFALRHLDWCELQETEDWKQVSGFLDRYGIGGTQIDFHMEAVKRSN